MSGRRWWMGLGLAAAAGAALWVYLRPAPLPPPPTAARLATLEAQRDALQARFRAAVLAHNEKSLRDAPQAGIMIGIPTSFTRSILQQVVVGLFGQTTLTLRNLKVHKEGAVKAKMLVRKRTLGKFVLDVDVRQVQGVLAPRTPTVDFGRNRIGLLLPVRLASGRGEASLRFRWDSKGLTANLMCGDVDVTRPVSGQVVPRDYEVAGSFAIAASASAIVLRPRFPDLEVRIFVDPSEEAWAVVDGVVRDRRKGCEIALNKVDVKEKLAGILGKGFNVKIPQKIFKPVILPAGISQSLQVQGLTLDLKVSSKGVLVANDRIWYGADVALNPRRPAPGSP